MLAIVYSNASYFTMTALTQAQKKQLSSLTPLQLATLTLHRKGLRNREIAQIRTALTKPVAETTVRSTLNKIAERLECSCSDLAQLRIDA